VLCGLRHLLKTQKGSPFHAGRARIRDEAPHTLTSGASFNLLGLLPPNIPPRLRFCFPFAAYNTLGPHGTDTYDGRSPLPASLFGSLRGFFALHSVSHTLAVAQIPSASPPLSCHACSNPKGMVSRAFIQLMSYCDAFGLVPCGSQIEEVVVGQGVVVCCCRSGFTLLALLYVGPRSSA